MSFFFFFYNSSGLSILSDATLEVFFLLAPFRYQKKKNPAGSLAQLWLRSNKFLKLENLDFKNKFESKYVFKKLPGYRWMKKVTARATVTIRKDFGEAVGVPEERERLGSGRTDTTSDTLITERNSSSRISGSRLLTIFRIRLAAGTHFP